MTGIEVDVGGRTTLVRVGGPIDGPPLVWLHGEGATSGWREVHDRLAGSFRVYAPVLPGFGGTELPSWMDGADDVALHLAELCTKLDLDHVVLVGESLGGWMAMTLAIWRPSLVVGLGLIGALGLRPAEAPPDLFIRSGPEMLGYLANSLDGRSVDPLEGDLDLATALWVEQAAVARIMWERPYDRKLPQRAHHVTAPVRVIWGAADRVLPVSHATALAQLFQRGSSGAVAPRVVPGAGHLVSIDAAAAVAEIITEAFG